MPYRLLLAGGWIDQPFVSEHNPDGEGSMVVVSLEPTVRFEERSGIATSTRAVAKRLWPMGLPDRPFDELVPAALQYRLAGVLEKMSRSLIAVLGLAWMGASPAFAQDVEITVFDELVPTTRTETPSVRAARLEAEVLEQPEAYELRWLLAEAYLRVAADIPERDTKRDLGYQAREQAAAAATLRPDGVEGHYWLSVAAGLVADNVGGRTKIRMGDQSWNESTWVLATDSLHAGAHHVQGRIHAGVMRLNAFTRFIGRILLGGDVLGEASWEGAEYHLRRAAELAPELPMHHLELATVYRDRDKSELMIASLRRTLDAPDSGWSDERYRDWARAMLDSIGGGP